jgi:hypothetical protein
MKNLKETIYGMLIENTGKALCDSGDAYGRNWERNQKKTLADFENEPEVDFDFDYADWKSKTYNSGEPDSSDIDFSVSTFKYLTSGVIELDEVCQEFNAKFAKMDDWDSDAAYGLSEEAEKWLVERGFGFGSAWNTYNGENFLDQTLQGCEVGGDGKKPLDYGDYVLIQVHGGCDVRGGYTDAKLFKYSDHGGSMINPCPTVYGTIGDKQVDTSWDGNTLRDENGKTVPISPEDKINLYISE